MNKQKVDKALFGDRSMISKNLQYSVVVEGRDVPIIHQWGRQNLKKYPSTQVRFAELLAKLGKYQQPFFGTESCKVVKMKEVYSAGIGNNAVAKLSSRGYRYDQIAKKLGIPVVREINIHHAIKTWKPGWLNLMLNEGIDEIWDLITNVDATNYYTNALARLGVGNSNSAVVATQTALQGGSTAFAAMDATYPLSTTTARVDFKGTFADGIAEFAWEEFTVDNGSSPNKNLQRVLASKGTKSAGEVWTAEVRITGS